MAILYSFPTVALMLGFMLAAYSKYVSLLFCFMFAYQMATIVQYGYDKFKEERDEKNT